MGSKNKGKVEETAQQRAMAELAMNRFTDWKQRYLPLQQRLIKQITDMGAPGSRVRESVSGRAATDTAMSFAKAQGGVQKALTDSGAQAGSSKFNLGVAKLGEDQAKSKGLGMALSDQLIDDAYLEGLASLAATGRGERAQATRGVERAGAVSGRQAAADAEAAAMNRAGNIAVAGQLAGYGLQSAIAAPPTQPTGSGSVPGGYNIDGRQFNNPSAWTPPG
jgi:hypothetical protein